VISENVSTVDHEVALATDDEGTVFAL